jgi:hypothetical protein
MRRPIDCVSPFEPQQKKRRLSPKKNVTFATDLTTVKYRQLSNEDLEQAWMQREDYRTIQKSAFQTVFTAKKMYGPDLDLLDQQEFCIRGLERAILKVTNKRTNSRPELFHFVLEEQRVQRVLGVSNSESLRTVSSLLSDADRLFARNLATTYKSTSAEQFSQFSTLAIKI